MTQKGAFVNNDLKESKINEVLIEKPGEDYGNRAFVRHLGIGGRMNGPVDNPASSCISCHARAATRNVVDKVGAGEAMSMVVSSRTDIKDLTSEQFATFFRSIPGNAHIERASDGNEFVTTDYSLQVTAGIRNFYTVNKSGLVKILKAESLFKAANKLMMSLSFLS